MMVNLGKKFELLAAAPDLYGRVYYFVSNGDVMSPKSYPKLVAEMVCAAWNGEDAKFYDVAEDFAALQDFAQYILRETENIIAEHGYKPLDDMDSNNTKMHIHVFVERLQKVKNILKK